MNDSTLNTLIDLAMEKRDAAAVALSRLRGQHDSSRSQLQALVEYRNEYAQRLAESMVTGLSVHKLDNDQQFLAAIDKAIAQQEQLVARSASQVAGGQRDWQDKQRRLKSFDTLAARNRQAQARQAAHREQQATDELAGQLTRHRP